MTDEESMALCAIRYTIGRMSYIVSDGWRWALEWGAKSAYVRDIIVRDLEFFIEQEDSFYLPENKLISGLGDTRTDSIGWRKVYAALLQMKEETYATNQ